MASYNSQLLPILCLLITVLVIDLFALSVELRGCKSITDMKNDHGVLSIVGWGIMFPVFVVSWRYVSMFRSKDEHRLQATCEALAFLVGMLGCLQGWFGWMHGLMLVIRYTGFMYSNHSIIGIVLLPLATLQLYGLLLKPETDLKNLLYWKINNHVCRYAVIILGVVNVFIGFGMSKAEPKWKTASIVAIAVLGFVATIVEVYAWMKPRDGSDDRRDYELISTVQSGDCEETCAICLETPIIGDKIRHLPCFHKFHKKCIDSWLLEKSSRCCCPVCQAFVN